MIHFLIFNMWLWNINISLVCVSQHPSWIMNFLCLGWLRLLLLFGLAGVWHVTVSRQKATGALRSRKGRWRLERNSLTSCVPGTCWALSLAGPHHSHSHLLKQAWLILCHWWQLRKEMWLTHGHTVTKWKSWDLNPGQLVPKDLCFQNDNNSINNKLNNFTKIAMTSKIHFLCKTYCLQPIECPFSHWMDIATPVF